MSNDTTKEPTGSLLTASILSAVFVGIAIILTLSVVGLPLMEAAVFAVLSGFTLGAFVYRERSLTHSYDHFRHKCNLEIDQLEKRISSYYESSLTCLASFDAATLLIERMSPGLLQLLRIPPDLKVRGKSIAELLHVTPSSIEMIVREAQRGTSLEHSHRLLAEDSYGTRLPVEMTAEYFKKTHMVEASFFVSPVGEREAVEPIDTTHKDLDRFRRGMYRREMRILELKEEVNEILKKAGWKPRYQFDQKTKDSNFPVAKMSDSKEAF